jgi:hypothetical protein
MVIFPASCAMMYDGRVLEAVFDRAQSGWGCYRAPWHMHVHMRCLLHRPCTYISGPTHPVYVVSKSSHHIRWNGAKGMLRMHVSTHSLESTYRLCVQAQTLSSGEQAS